MGDLPVFVQYLSRSHTGRLSLATPPWYRRNYGNLYKSSAWGAENAGHDVVGQDNDGQI